MGEADARQVMPFPGCTWRLLRPNKDGCVYLAGFTRSDDFPPANPLQASRSGTTCGCEFCSDAYVSKLDLSSSALRYSTYLGGGVAALLRLFPHRLTHCPLLHIH